MNIKNKFFDHWFPILVHIACLLPIPWLIWDAWSGNLTANPIRGSILRTGKIALELLVLSLACTPLNTIFGFKPALRVRRALGDYSFLYTSLHFAIFVSLDYGFDFQLVFTEVIRPYALVGLIAGLLLIPLAITSFPPWLKRLGKNWKRLHNLVYVINLLAALHFMLVVKQGVTEPYLWMIMIIFLLVLRIPPIRHFLTGFFTHQE
ncbi:MAG: protein-methionine-sulfoxide reductase heme-binding subunit MsrQ [Anaerolineales bacterium]